ncbi:cell division cycle 25 [Perkinsus olseni]|uniref:Cell division cycle 25 n=2 Tax=Perkinsus olseni TaxID=32597 RepID=A0A7J6T783_PEROL|nr:cell division cycle 25 [Perkinsus olseni]
MISSEDITRPLYGMLFAFAGDENMAACWGSATSGVAPVEGPLRTATKCRGDGSVMRVPSCCEAMQRSGGRLLEERPMRVALAGLCCHHPIVMQIEVKGDQAGDDQLTREEQQFWLGLLILESAASSIGRGAMTLDTQDRPLFNMEEVSTSGRYSSSRATVTLSSSTGPSMDWPEFHNGVAFGLAVRPPRGRRPDREWFIRNMRWKRTSDDSCFRRAGLLMGLGLHGYMTPDVFRPDDWLVEIGMGNCASICAVLLGVGASNIGSRDLKACRLCYLHTPALAGQVDQSTGSSTQTLVQCCGVVALGLLHYKSAHVTLATTLLKNLRDLGSITGGSDECGVGLRPAYGVSLGVAFALAYADKPLPRNLEDEIMACTKDIDSSVPAYVALGLLYYGKADSRVLEVLQLPRTRHQLCRRRPNCWFAVAVAHTMVQGEVPDLPSFVGGCREKYRATAGESSPFVEAEAALYMEAGCMLGLALSNMGTDDLGVRDRILAALERMLRVESWQEGMPSVTSFGAITSHPPDDCGPDSKTLLTCRLSVLLSAATVMAGSGCPRVSAFIDRVRQKVFESTHTPAAEFEFVYGIHQALHLATGLLHLGWGRCKLKNNALGRAAVLLALWPGYRHDVSDMKYHVQVFRHLYCLAVEKRARP